MNRLCALAIVALSTVCGCNSAPPSGGEKPPAHDKSPLPDITSTARHAERGYLMTRTGSRCDVFVVDDLGTSPPNQVNCPPDSILLPGERIRIAGKVCMREGPDPNRVLPVICPDPLTNLEKRERAARGLDIK